MSLTQTKGTIVLTGGAGFIGSNCARALNNAGRDDLIIVDHLDDPRKEAHLQGIRHARYYDRDEFLPLLETLEGIGAIIHLGACADTAVTDRDYFARYNVQYSRTLFDWCAAHGVRFIYASSAATYGDGRDGYDEDNRNLHPLNAYGESKHLFDEYVRDALRCPPAWAGLKFFNVYGPYEDHKDAMASMVWQGYQQIMWHGAMRLFKSTREGFPHGSEERDFIYVGDVVNIIMFLLTLPQVGGIINVGTGNARSFLDLSTALFRSLDVPPRIEWFDMPQKFRGAYQYHTEADLRGLRHRGYDAPCRSLEAGVEDYVRFLRGRRKGEEGVSP